MTSHFSIREALQGNLRDLCSDSGVTCVNTETLVRDLVSLLASYREEDSPLFPDVFVIMDRSALTKLSPGTEHFVLGTSEATEAAAKALKDCATIAVGNWAIYILRNSATEFEYGIFRSSRHSYSITASESLLSLSEETILYIHNCGHLSVEIHNSKGADWCASFTAKPAKSAEFKETVNAIAECMSSNVAEQFRERFQLFLVDFLSSILLRCHGTLLAIVKDENWRDLTGCADGVHLKCPIALFEKFVTAVSDNTADSLADLQAAQSLIEGMVDSDGIVVFNNRGEALAFRVFIQPTEAERTQVPAKGGGRRRTYELLKLRVQAGSFEAAAFRSQDGTTAMHKRVEA